jgi:hypothetical protein
MLCGICGGQRIIMAGFLRVLKFPVSHPINCSLLIIIRGWYNRPNSGQLAKWTQSHPKCRTRFFVVLTAYGNKLFYRTEVKSLVKRLTEFSIRKVNSQGVH